ncbi:uncharacterized protein VICG_00390 [Vittaforma corneae ATCC 50505]|uniref:TFIIS N-terminal domain-containing protein n=1 Tax=Vittaforma corneae (strain ATCC 50505) TaxID=993615 RepID=L2GP38_VITCO|nr:uncharacterized protein VICG_00390 [Vittaforma corneae ATCC 50505]ELA42638.1 hypothetical protein VICG_00390 [Vittaforma corneae ATCC 50505]
MEDGKDVNRNRTRRIVMVDSDEENAINNTHEVIQTQNNTQSQAGEAQIQEIQSSNEAQAKLQSYSQNNNDAQKKKKAKIALSLKTEDIEKYCYDVITEMKDFYKKDLDLNSESKPAHYKIDNIEHICSKIIKRGVQEIFVKMGILKELKVWLEPLPDNSLPNQKIKRAIMDLLINLRVSKADLLSSGIGKIVHFYSKNSREALDIRKMSLNVIKKWKSMIIKEEIEQ